MKHVIKRKLSWKVPPKTARRIWNQERKRDDLSSAVTLESRDWRWRRFLPTKNSVAQNFQCKAEKKPLDAKMGNGWGLDSHRVHQHDDFRHQWQTTGLRIKNGLDFFSTRRTRNLLWVHLHHDGLLSGNCSSLQQLRPRCLKVPLVCSDIP